jgi:hypothetical protein
MSQAITLRLCVDENYQTGFLVRTMRLDGGREALQLLTRYGEWVSCTAEQLREQDIPSDCILAAHDLPSAGAESSQISRDPKNGG